MAAVYVLLSRQTHNIVSQPSDYRLLGTFSRVLTRTERLGNISDKAFIAVSILYSRLSDTTRGYRQHRAATLPQMNHTITSVGLVCERIETHIA